MMLVVWLFMVGVADCSRVLCRLCFLVYFVVGFVGLVRSLIVLLVLFLCVVLFISCV